MIKEKNYRQKKIIAQSFSKEATKLTTDIVSSIDQVVILYPALSQWTEYILM